MQTKSMFRYAFHDIRRPVLIFYGCFYAVFFTTYALFSLMPPENGHLYFNGQEMAGLIFLFVMGLNCLKEPLKMGLQNGVSRRTVLRSFTAVLLLGALLMGIFDALIAPVLQRLFQYDSFLQLIYARLSIPSLLANMLWNVPLYCMGAMFGLFLGSLYYRMSKMQKIVVSIGVPVLIGVVLPLIDALLLHGQITAAISRMLLALFGTYASSLISMLALALLFLSLSRLCTHRIPVRE